MKSIISISVVKATLEGTILEAYKFTGDIVDTICSACEVVSDYGINIAPVDILSDFIADDGINKVYYLDGIATLTIKA